MNKTPDRREHPRTLGNFKNMEDVTYKILRKHEKEKNEIPHRKD
jgi:hypothetical protein